MPETGKLLWCWKWTYHSAKQSLKPVHWSSLCTGHPNWELFCLWCSALETHQIRANFPATRKKANLNCSGRNTPNHGVNKNSRGIFIYIKTEQEKYTVGPKLACLPRTVPFSVKGPCDTVWDTSVGLVLSRTKLPHLHLCISCPQAWSVSIHPPVYPLLPKPDCTELCWGQSLWHVFIECIKGTV